MRIDENFINIFFIIPFLKSISTHEGNGRKKSREMRTDNLPALCCQSIVLHCAALCCIVLHCAACLHCAAKGALSPPHFLQSRI